MIFYLQYRYFFDFDNAFLGLLDVLLYKATDRRLRVDHSECSSAYQTRLSVVLIGRISGTTTTLLRKLYTSERRAGTPFHTIVPDNLYVNVVGISNGLLYFGSGHAMAARWITEPTSLPLGEIMVIDERSLLQLAIVRRRTFAQIPSTPTARYGGSSVTFLVKLLTFMVQRNSRDMLLDPCI